jgi:cysteine desulfurase/selenocysteine lyase
VRVATILHTSPVTGMAVDRRRRGSGCDPCGRTGLPSSSSTASSTPAHGRIDIAGYGIDGYVISPYKVFSRHGYGVAWTSRRV